MTISEAAVATGPQPRVAAAEAVDEAARRCEAVLAAAPADHDALLHLGLIRLAMGRLRDAVALFERAVAARPASVTARLRLGAALGELGRGDDALACCRDALSIEPDNAAAHWVLGATLRRHGRPAEALPCFERAVAIKPDFAAAHCALADTLQDLGALDAAVVHYQSAIALQPRSFEAANNLGSALQKLGRCDDAVAHYRRALDLNPGSTAIACNLATALKGAGRTEDGVVILKNALGRDPSSAEAHKLLGFAFEVLGRRDDAVRAFETSLTLAPADGEVHRRLAELRPFTPGDPRLAALETLAGDTAAFSTDNRISLHFAAARALGDAGRHERAFHHWRQGNALKRAQLAYDAGRHRRQLDRTRAVFTTQLMARHAGRGCNSEVPVFVVGMPRSGTTLVEQILASHAQVHGAGEIDTFHRVLGRRAAADGVAGGFPELAAGLSPGAVAALGADYVASLTSRARSAAAGAARIVNKLPGNFQYAGLIHLALPNARIIHVRRDPLDTCFSCFSLLFAFDHQPFSYDLGDLGRYYRAYAALMAHWRRVLPPGAMLEVRYEDLVDDLEGQARAIVDHCGLAWQDACLAFHENRRPVRTASLYQVRQPIFRTSVGRWRPYRRFLEPLITALNEADTGGADAP